MTASRQCWRQLGLVGFFALGLFLPLRPAVAADPNPAAQATCTTDDGVTCTIRGQHEVPSGSVLDYGDRQVVLAGRVTLATGPGPRSLTIRTSGDFVVRAAGRIGTEQRGRSGRDGGDLTLVVGGALTLHGHLDLEGHPSHGTGGTLVLTTGGPLTLPASGAILADGRTGGTLDLTIGGDLTLAGRLKARGHASHGQGGTITLTTAGSVTVRPPGRLRVDGATAGAVTLRVRGPLSLDGDLSADGKQGGAMTLQAEGSVTVGPHAAVTVEGQGRHGRGGSIAANFCGPAATLAGRLRAVGAGGADGGSIAVTSRGPLTLTGRLKAFGEGRGAKGGTIALAAAAGLTFGPHARLTAEGHPEGTITLAAPDPLETAGLRSDPPFRPVALPAICGLSPLQVARANHTATLLADGTVLLAGGRNGTGPVGSLERFDPAPGTFTLLGSALAPPREGHTATSLPDGTVLVLGGQNSQGAPLALAERFDPAAGTLTPLSTDPALARSGHTATLLLDGTILLTGGTEGTGVLPSALLFDPSSGMVSALASGLTVPRAGHTATLLPDGSVLLTGGASEGTTALDSAELFDPTTQAFSGLSAPALSPSNGRLSAPRLGHSATLLPDGSVLILGGTSDGTTSLASGEFFDPSTGTFSALGAGRSAPFSLLRARREHTATLLGDGTLLVTGGFGSGPLPTAERLNLGLADSTAPTVVAVRPPDQATEVPSDSRVAIRFSEPLNPVTLTSDSFRLIDHSTTQPVDGAVVLGEGALLAFFTPTAPLTAGRPYTVQLTSEIKDTSGNALVPFTSTFTVQGAAAPLALTPATLTLHVGQTGTLTIQLPTPAPPTGVTVTLESANPSIATMPASVSIAAGQTSAPVQVRALTPGTVNLTASAPDFTAATSVVTVLPAPPTISSFTPTSGKVSTSVTLTGTNFFNVQSVIFNGVPVSSFSVTGTTTLTTTVPSGATSGPISMTTAGGTATSSGHFIVLPTQDFSLVVEPTSVTAIAGTSVSLKVSTVTTGGFTGLTQLGTGTLPLVGVTAAFNPPYLGPNASGLLTLTTSASTPSTSTIEVRGTATIEGVAVTRTATASLNVRTAGQTVLLGQVLDENEKPIPGVSIKLGGTTITTLGTTDAAGNFLINLSVADTQVFLIDGSTASTSTVSYPTIPLTLNIQASTVNSLGFVPHLHSQPTAKLIPISPGQETVLTDPDLPGFTMTIPAGVSIIGWDGQANTQVSVTAIPIDRSPLPPPPPGQTSRVVYLFSFGKVGGGLPTGNIPVDTPNDVNGLPGEKVDLYYFNEAPDGSAPNRWEKYGTGTVSSDGTRIITDTNPATGKPYGIPRFCCGGRRNSPPPPPPRPGGGPSGGSGDSGQPAGEPVDTATGFFYLTKTDLILPGLIPLVITRTYRTNLTNAGPFGLGTSWDYDRFLQPPPNGSPDALLLFSPGNRQDLFTRQTDGTFINTTSPGLRGAVVTVAGDLRTLRFKDGTAWRFRVSDGLLVSQTDRHGNTLTIFRDSQGRVTSLVEPRGRSLTFSYSGTNLRIDQITDPLGRTVQYAYDGSGRLTAVTDPAGGISRYTYDAQHRLLTLTDPRGITFLTNEYDSAGRVTRQTQADGGIWQFAYTTTGSFISQTTVTDPRGNPTTYRFNSGGYLISQTDALGQTTTFTRQTGTNLLLATTDPLGRVTRFAYDASGNVTQITDPLGNIRTFTYDLTFNKMTSLTDPLGNLTTFEYDANGNLIATTDPEQYRKPEGERLKTRIAYNQFGQPTATTDPVGNTTTFTYDGVGNLTVLTDPLGNTTQRSYDTVSRLLAQTDPLGKTTRFSYDALNRLVAIVDALGGGTSFAYDPNGNLLSVTDARGNTITHEYDAMDRLSRRIDQLGKAETFSYDGNGNLVSTTDRKLQTTTFTYDALNRRTWATYADGAIATFTYDAAGRLLQADDTADPHRPIALEYDSLDRLLAETTTLGTVGYQYDALGRRTQMIVSGQSPVTYTYDANSRLRTITQAPLAPVDIQYDALGRRTLLTLPNGVSTAYDYDLASRLIQLTYAGPAGLLGNLTYQYDPAGNRVEVGSTFARTLIPGPLLSALYDAANQQLVFGDKSMTFDANGNLSSITEPTGTMTFTWDARNRLVAITGPTITASFAYDAFGRRLAKTINGATITFHYDGVDVIRESGPPGEATYLRSLAIDETLARTDTSGTLTYLADALGSSVSLVDGAGGLTTSYTYAPFGETAVAGGPNPSPFQFTGRENDGTGLYYYRARYYLPTLGRFVSRDPLTYGGLKAQFGRLLPGVSLGGLGGRLLRDPDAQHGYTYGTGNPLAYTDPLGWQILSPQVGGAIRGIGTGVGALHPGGTGAMMGAVLLGTAGALAGSLVPVPGGTIVGGLTGAIVGGTLGSVFDNPCAGLPNCGEAEDLRRWREQKEIEEIRRDLERAQQLLDRLNRITDAMMDILQPRAKP